MEIFAILKDYIYRKLQHFKKIQSLYTNEFPFLSSMHPCRGHKVILEDGTVKADKVAMMDLELWVSRTKAHL